MKIGSLPPIGPVDGPAQQPRSSAREGQDATQVTLSRDASFVEDLRGQASEAPFRDDLVADARAQVESGSLSQNADLSRVVDGLLADL